MVKPDGDQPMKNLTPNHGQNTSDVAASTSLVRHGTLAIGSTIRRLSFWSAILLPLVYLPLLSGGLVGWQVPTFVVLFALNVLALFVGHDYGRSAS